MKKTYKLWAYVEECDETEGKESYEDISMPIIIGTFNTKDKAFELADLLYMNREEI